MPPFQPANHIVIPAKAGIHPPSAGTPGLAPNLIRYPQRILARRPFILRPAQDERVTVAGMTPPLETPGLAHQPHPPAPANLACRPFIMRPAQDERATVAGMPGVAISAIPGP